MRTLPLSTSASPSLPAIGDICYIRSYDTRKGAIGEVVAYFLLAGRKTANVRLHGGICNWSEMLDAHDGEPPRPSCDRMAPLVVTVEAWRLEALRW